MFIWSTGGNVPYVLNTIDAATNLVLGQLAIDTKTNEITAIPQFIQIVGLISDRIMSAKELGDYKRAHWKIENNLHHVLDDDFREDRSTAKKS